ncbi:DUF4383 domain-containing protein [Saccharomonospora glauca]|uniref:DUF4383 domain-containing protein n=1 Tax=Saccharomonospora glauca K62 TaxID=928724 RepID=I1D2I5_9PSEU|nr:DUF4383 domain-containing protein [Saccharomonospora glauca]EIE99159.1 hypothetical protein SacglDRAFT_02262 [Saccharomonospora glauca K62]
MSQDVSPQVSDEHRLVRVFALVVGIVFVLVGVAGFVPGLTEGVGEMTFAGPDSDAFLFGVFAVSILHNLVHLLFGVAGIAAATRAAASRGYLIVGGGVYLLLWVYGVGTHDDSAANFVPLNRADDWLHLGLGLGMIGLGVLATTVERRHNVYPEPPEEREAQS